jgi:hypothetical protein
MEKYCFEVYRSLGDMDLRWNTFIFEANSRKFWNIKDTEITNKVKDRFYIFTRYKYLLTIDTGPDLMKYSKMMEQSELNGKKQR